MLCNMSKHNTTYTIQIQTLRRVMRPPRPPSTAEVAEVEAQKSEAFTSLKVDYAALFIIDFNLIAELLPKSFVHCPNQPVMSLIGVDLSTSLR